MNFMVFAILFTASSSFPRGTINPLLHEQALSHLAFHSPSLKLALAKLFPALKSVAVVGVEWGDEVQFFARSGYHVYAFEPAKTFVSHLQEIVDRNPNWNVSIIPIAVGNSSRGQIDLKYDNHNISERVPVGTVDEHIREALAVLSLDIQGDELHVLQGSAVTLSEQVGVHSIWVEAIACNDKVREVLAILDQAYVIFDFVPWGKHVDNSNEVPTELKSFAFNPDRPAEFDAFLHWMCNVSRTQYQWLQTDFLAVRHDLASKMLLNELSKLADHYCGDGPGRANCVLRRLLLSDLEKDEL